MATVQRTCWTVHGQLESNDATQAKDRLQTTTLVNRAIAEKPGIGPQQVAVLLQNCLQVTRSCFFFSLEEELHVERGRYVLRAHRIESGEHGDDRSLVVARRTG